MSAIRGIACSRAESMIWERSQAPPENKDSYIHWSAEPRRQLATPASPRLLLPIPCAPSTAEASRCSLALRHPIATRSRPPPRFDCMPQARPRPPRSAACAVAAKAKSGSTSICARALRIVTLYAIINIIVIFIVKRESSCLPPAFT